MSATKDCFPLFDQKILTEDIALISWCPTKDLVLLVSLSSTLLLYRNGADLVWTIDDRFESTIKVITWNPNGKEFVVGCEDGTVYKIDIRHHSPVVSTCWNNSEERGEEDVSITSLLWIDYCYSKNQMKIEGFDSDAFDFDAMLPTLSNEPPVEPLSRFPIPKNKRTSLPNKPASSSDTQTLLIIGNENGHVHILLSGMYPICHIRLDEFDKNARIIDISAASDTTGLQILTKSIEDQYKMYIVDTQFLKERKEDVFNISERQAQLNYLLQYLHCSTQVLKRHHDSYSSFSRRIASMAAEAITNQDDQASAMPEIELIGTLATGNLTESLQEFMVDFLTPQKIKEWESLAMHGYHNSLKTACQYILPACDRIQLELSKLLGYSLWTERYGGFLESSSVESCIDCIQEFMKEIVAFTKSLNSLIKSFSAFIKWILSVSEKISDPDSIEPGTQFGLCEEPDFVFEYLDTCFVKDAIAKYFAMSTESNCSLIKRLNDISLCCKQMLKKLSQIFSNKTHVIPANTITAEGVSLERQVKKITAFTEENNQQNVFYAMLQSSPKRGLLILKKPFKNSRVEYALLMPRQPIADFEFFDTNELAILSEDQEETILHTVLLETLEFKDLETSSLVSQEFKPYHSQNLGNIQNTKISCNGREKRRIFCVVASNGCFRTFSMDEEEESEDEDEEDD